MRRSAGGRSESQRIARDSARAAAKNIVASDKKFVGVSLP